jgi:hypothetical protein
MRIAVVTEQTVAVMRARNKAFRWPKGKAGTRAGSRAFIIGAQTGARGVAGDDAGANSAGQRGRGRTRQISLSCLRSRSSGSEPIDKPEYEPERDDFDPDKYTPEELNEIERALLLIVDPARVRRERREDMQEVLLPPGRGSGKRGMNDPSPTWTPMVTAHDPGVSTTASGLRSG